MKRGKKVKYEEVRYIKKVVLYLVLSVCNMVMAQNNTILTYENDIKVTSKEIENKPIIDKINVVGYTLSKKDPTLYNVEIEVSYRGGDECSCAIEEEGNPCITNYFSKTTDYAKFFIKNVDSWSRTVAYITVYNSYGDVTVTVELDPSELYPTGISNKQIQDDEMNLFGPDSPYDIVLYDIKGQCVLKAKAAQGIKTSSLTKGIYIMEVRDGKTIRLKRKIKL